MWIFPQRIRTDLIQDALKCWGSIHLWDIKLFIINLKMQKSVAMFHLLCYLAWLFAKRLISY